MPTITKRDAEHEIWMMLHDPHAYAVDCILEGRDALRMSLVEGPQLGAGFHEAAINARAELRRKRAEVYRHEAERLTIQEVLPSAPRAQQDWTDSFKMRTILRDYWREGIKFAGALAVDATRTVWHKLFWVLCVLFAVAAVALIACGSGGLL